MEDHCPSSDCRAVHPRARRGGRHPPLCTPLLCMDSVCMDSVNGPGAASASESRGWRRSRGLLGAVLGGRPPRRRISGGGLLVVAWSSDKAPAIAATTAAVLVTSNLSVVVAAAAVATSGGECIHQAGEQAVTLVGLGWGFYGSGRNAASAHTQVMCDRVQVGHIGLGGAESRLA